MIECVELQAWMGQSMMDMDAHHRSVSPSLPPSLPFHHFQQMWLPLTHLGMCSNLNLQWCLCDRVGGSRFGDKRVTWLLQWLVCVSTGISMCVSDRDFVNAQLIKHHQFFLTKDFLILSDSAQGQGNIGVDSWLMLNLLELLEGF